MKVVALVKDQGWIFWIYTTVFLSRILLWNEIVSTVLEKITSHMIGMT